MSQVYEGEENFKEGVVISAACIQQVKKDEKISLDQVMRKSLAAFERAFSE